MFLTKNDVIKSAQALLGGLEGELVAHDNPRNIDELALRVGVVIIDDDEKEEAESFPIETGTMTFIDSTGDSDFLKAMAIGAYLLFTKSSKELSEDEFNKCILFAVTTQFPEIDEYDQPTLDELIGLSIRVKVPFASLKIAFEQE